MKAAISKRWEKSGPRRRLSPLATLINVTSVGWGGVAPPDMPLTVMLTDRRTSEAGEAEHLWIRLDDEAAEAFARALLDKVASYRQTDAYKLYDATRRLGGVT